jgi:leucyl/phenylalanyl-tRNA--protein transferase
MPVYQLTDQLVFPPPRLARDDGLLAIGGDLSKDRLLMSYRQGIFPWYSAGETILWWSPDPRLVLYPAELKISRSLKKVLRQQRFEITLDRAFDAVISACAETRGKKRDETWIGKDMIRAYRRLHRSGHAHSVEAWYGKRLAGGLYGVSLGRSFFGESMFSRIPNASKTALVALVQYLEKHDFDLIDCQVRTDHLVRFGAREIPRNRFLQQLRRSLERHSLKGPWSMQKISAETFV